MLQVQLKHHSKLIVDAVPLHALHAHLLGYLLAVLLGECVLGLGAYRGDDVAGRLEHLLNEGRVPGRDLTPGGEGVARQGGVVVQQILPLVRDRVQDDDVHARPLAGLDGLHVALRREGLREAQHLVFPQVAVEVGRMVLRVDDGYPGPVAFRDAFGDEKRGHGLAPAAGGLQQQPDLAPPAVCFS